MRQILNTLDRWLATLLMLLMTLMVFDVTWQVLTRFILRDPSSYTEELARFLLMWIGLLGAAYAYRKHAHLGLDIVTRALQPSARQKVELVANVLSLGFALSVMVVGGAKLMLLTLELDQISAALGIKIGLVYSVLPLSGVLISVFALDNIRRVFAHLPALPEEHLEID